MSVTSTVVVRAETRFVEAAARLRPYVGCFGVITAERGARIQIVPFTLPMMIARLSIGAAATLAARTPEPG
jgi:hypothetical protein